MLELPQLAPIVVDWPEHLAAPQIPQRMVWHQSSLKRFRTCKREFFWRVICGVRPRRLLRTPLLLGNGFHECVAEWYRTKRSSMSRISGAYADTLREDLEKASEWADQDEFDKARQGVNTFQGMMMGYAENYKADRQNWIIDRDHIEVSFSLDMGDFDFAGTMDLFARKSKSGRSFLVEHKTASKIDGNYIARLPMDTQSLCYTHAAKECFGIKVDHVLYDVVKKCKLRRKAVESVEDFAERVAQAYFEDPDYFFRTDLKFTDNDFARFEHDIRQTHAEYLLYAGGEMGDPLDPNTWTANDSSCYRFFTNCEYINCCLPGRFDTNAIELETVEDRR